MIGGHQERNRRAGTENVAGIIGMGKAAEIALGHMSEDAVGIKALRDQLEELLLESCPGSRVNGRAQNRLAEYFEYQFSIFGRGVDPGASRSARNMRFDWLRLHRGIVRAVARSACYESTR